MRRILRGLALIWAGARLFAADPGPTQTPGTVNPPYHGAAINSPFPDNYYGAGHGGSSLSLSYPFTSPFGNTDHSRGVVTYSCAPFTPRNSEGVYGMDVWLEASVNGGDWGLAGGRGGLADGAGSAYQPVNTPNPGPSPAYRFQWTFDGTTLPANAVFRVWVYVYLYNQGGGSQGNFYVGTSAGYASAGAANDPPSITWDVGYGAVNPAGVSAGQPYQISATAADDNGNLAAVQIWRDGTDFAAAGGGDGWSSTAGAAAAGGGETVTYTAQAIDAAGLSSAAITWTVTALSLQAQPPVASTDAALILGQSFTPVELGGAGSGGWQFAVGGYTNFNGGATADTGTQAPEGGWSPSWTAPAAGTYSFWVSRNGDGAYAPSAIAGPYALTVVDPNASSETQPDPAVMPPALAPVTADPGPPAPVALGGSPAPLPPPSAAAAPFSPPQATGSPAPWTQSAAPPASPSPVSTPAGGVPALLVPHSSASAPSLAAPAAPTPPSAAQPIVEIARLRFNGTGHDATVHSPVHRGASVIWTDPAGIAASPWPSFSPVAAGTATTGAFALPAGR